MSRARDQSRLSVDGAKIIPYKALGAGAIDRPLFDKLAELNTPADRGAVGDGVADDRLALIAAEDHAPVTISKNHRVSSDLTFAKPVRFVGSGRLTIDAGVTVTFADTIVAGDRQIFYGDGNVAGLLLSKYVWFAGDLRNTTTDALVRLQKAIDAAPTSGAVEHCVGFFTITGATALNFSKGQYCYGYGAYKSEIRYSSTSSNVWNFNGTIAPRLEGVSALCTNIDAPASGTVLIASASFFTWCDVTIRSCNNGILLSGVSGPRGTNFDIFNAMGWGFGLNNVNDVFVSQFLISAPLDNFSLASVTGAFTLGETIVGGTSGATANVAQIVSASQLKCAVAAYNFTPGETITGAISGATATVTAQVVPHLLGGFRLTNKVEAFNATDGDVIGGVYSMTTDAASFAPYVRPAYCKFTNIYMDSADEGVALDKAVEFDFISCWFSNRPARGIVLYETDGIRFNGGGAVNCHTNGMFITAEAKRTVVTNFAARGNSVADAGEHAGILVAAGTTDFTIAACTLGGSIGFGTQSWGVAVEVGASDRYSIVNNLVDGNTVGGVQDGGTGVNKAVERNY